MNILAINTTTKVAEIVCGNKDKNISENINGTFSEHIMQSIQSVLSKSTLNIGDIDILGVVTGPGSFTGIRIGMAVVKGIACGLETKSVAVNSFELVSYNINSSNFVVLLDSGNAEVYYAIFKAKKVLEMGHGTVEQIKKFASEKNLKIYYFSFEKNIFGNIPELEEVDVQKDTLINLIEQKAISSEFSTISQLCPIYIKLSQAEIGLEQKLKENLTFRVAELNDAEALSIVDEQSFEIGTERYDKKSFVEELSEESKHYIVALFGKLVIGYVGLQKVGDDLNLLKVAVLPQYRSLGVGFSLMQKALDYRFDKNFQKYFLEVREHNEKAIKLYQKFGFKTVSKREKYYSDGENALVMFAK